MSSNCGKKLQKFASNRFVNVEQNKSFQGVQKRYRIFCFICLQNLMLVFVQHTAKMWVGKKLPINCDKYLSLQVKDIKYLKPEL